MEFGIGLFVQEGAYTTLSAAVSMLVVLTLLFSTASAVWALSRAGDVQVAADATALSGANVVSSYYTTATVLDASILSLGLAGFALCGAGLAGSLVPGARGPASGLVETGVRMLRSRNEFCASASRGLSALERSLPYLVAARSADTCSAQKTSSVSFAGVALAVPRNSDSSFPAIDGPGCPTEELEAAGEELDAAAGALEEARGKATEAKREAWLADCGDEGRCMQERAGKLTSMPSSLNPDYASSLSWNPAVAIDRAREYYRWRFEHETPEGPGIEKLGDSVARKAFYGFALEELEGASYSEAGGTASCSMARLPRNTDGIRKTRLYSESRWPSTREPEGLVLHCDASCPGARGHAGAPLPLSAIEAGTARECPVCHFSVGDLGRAPAASTSIDNGFEFHLERFQDAMEVYCRARTEELEAEDLASKRAEGAANAFDEAIGRLSCERPRIAPPGRDGCVALVSARHGGGSSGFDNLFAPAPDLGGRGAVSAAALAPDGGAAGENVLSEFFSSVSEKGGGAVGVIDGVMDLWGKLLVSYGDLAGELDRFSDELAGDMGAAGAGPIARWLGDRISGALRGLGIEPVDLSMRKPVITDSANVVSRSDCAALADIQGSLRSIEVGSADPEALLGEIGYDVGEHIVASEFTIAEIPLPGGGSIPLTVSLRDFVGAWGG